MKILIVGGTGQIGRVLVRHFKRKKYSVRILTRKKNVSPPYVTWDGKHLGEWQKEIDDSDVLINLAGKSVNCRYNNKNLKEMMDSRVDSTRIIGEAISKSKTPPKLWLQMSTATIYAHSFERNNDEYTGIIGGREPDVPRYWDYSIKIARAWEKTLMESQTPETRKVILRSAMVMSPDKGGTFDMLSSLVRFRLGGPVGGGRQYMSWIHEDDFTSAVDFLMSQGGVEGVVNLASPNPVTQRKFMADLRAAQGVSLGLPATKWMARIGAFFLNSDTELILKSRRVVSKRFNDLGFKFQWTHWKEASQELSNRYRKMKKSVVIYDQDCGLCQMSRKCIERLDWCNRFAFRTLQDDNIYREYPVLTPQKCSEQMHVIHRNGRIYGGGNALARILSDLPLLAPLGLIARLPFLRPLINRGYIIIARNRYRISSSCGIRPPGP